MLKPDDPHAAVLFVLVFASLMGWLFQVGLTRYLNPAARTPRRDTMMLLGWGYLWVIVLLVNAAVASSAERRWLAAATMPLIESLRSIEAADNGAPVLLGGKARPARESGSEAGPAYVIEYDLDGERWDENPELRVELADGMQRVSGLDTAIDWNWRYERGHRVRYSLASGEPLVVLGVIRHGKSLAGSERGALQVWVEAGLVRRGTHADFVAAAEQQSRRLWPRGLAWASLASAAVVGLLPIWHSIRRRPG